MTMTDSRNRRWYQFSLRMLLAIVTVSALGLAWWRHRSDCLERSRFHAEQNLALAKEILKLGQLHGILYAFRRYDSEAICSLTVMPRESSSGCPMVVFTIHSGNLSDKDKERHAEMTREAELSDQYYHAIWRPWERLWIDESR